MSSNFTTEELKTAIDDIKFYVYDLQCKNKKYETFINSLLSPEEYGYAVTNEVRDAARIALGMKPVESRLAKKIKLTYQNVFLDGGTKVYSGSDYKIYYVDYRLGTTTAGELYDKYPGDEGAKMLDKNDFEFIEE